MTQLMGVAQNFEGNVEIQGVRLVPYPIQTELALKFRKVFFLTLLPLGEG